VRRTRSQIRKACGLAGALGAAIAAATAAGCGHGEPAAVAMEAPRPGGLAQDVVLATAPLGDAGVLVVIVDARRDRLAVYQADTRRNRLKLLAVRDLSADWSLTDYNNDPPLPRDIRARVEKMLERVPPPESKGEVPAASP
jgi:hypothetical protein